MPQSKEAYQAEIQAHLDEVNQQIDELKIEAEQRVGEDFTAEYDRNQPIRQFIRVGSRSVNAQVMVAV